MEDSEDAVTPLFEADKFREEAQRHGETIFGREYKDAVIRRLIPTSYSDVKFAFQRDTHFMPRKDLIDGSKHLPHRRTI